MQQLLQQPTSTLGLSSHRCNGWRAAVTSLLAGVVLLCFSRMALAAEITPFDTFDQSPLVQIYGLPAPGRAKVLAPGEYQAGLTMDLANDFAHNETERESISLDGETLRSTLSLARGIAGGYEAGLELPIVSQSGGFMDGFIEGWHHFFHLPNGNRSDSPRNRLSYFYEKDGATRLNFNNRNTGIGDLRLTGGSQLYRDELTAVTLRAALKLPTGDSAGLLGSGSTDLALWATADHDYPFESLGHAAIFGALGALGKTEGDVLPSQERYLVGFGSLGAGWSPTKRLAFKLQLSGHSPFYRDSDLVELNAFSLLLTFGGTVAFTEKTALDIGVSEDVLINRSPDITFHLALTTRF